MSPQHGQRRERKPEHQGVAVLATPAARSARPKLNSAYWLTRCKAALTACTIASGTGQRPAQDGRAGIL